VRILFVGDVVGKPGRRILRESLPGLRREHGLQYVVVNGENAAGGVGLTPPVARELLELGVDGITLGNHTWDKRELGPAMDEIPALVRPLNYPPGAPGRGVTVLQRGGAPPLGLLNAMGRVFAAPALDCPFRAVEAALEELRARARVVLLDFHAEATSEKVAMGWFLDGRVSAVIGTHTHVQTSDACVLPGGTAYVTDAGMTGPWVSALGMERGRIIERFLTQLPVRFEVAPGPCQLNAVVVDADEATGRAREITAIARREPLAGAAGEGMV
jgi:metallophosphoesterase (TIGR00282 family)